MNPIEFKRGVFYSFAWLESQLQPIMSLQTFLTNLRLDCTGRNRLFQNGLFGDEILQAIEDSARRDKVPDRATQPEIHPFPAANSPRKRGRPRKHPAQVKDFC